MAQEMHPDSFTLSPNKVGAEHASREGQPAGPHAVFGALSAATRVTFEGRLVGLKEV